MNALLERGTLAGLAANGNGGPEGGLLAQRRFELRFGYGIAAFGGRFTMVPEAGLGFSAHGRDYSLGWRLARGNGNGSLEMSVEARRHEDDNAARRAGRAEHTVGVRLNARF